MQQLNKTNQFETKNIGLLLLIYTLPPLVVQILTFAYNVVDKLFLGKYDSVMALGGVSAATPIMNVIQAFGTLVCVGASVCMSLALGKKDYEKARNVLGNSVLLSIFIGLLYMIVCYLFMNRILMLWFGSNYPIDIMRRYLFIVLPGLFMSTMATNLTGLMCVMGRPFKSMLIMAGGIVLNIILDYVFICVLKWGVGGAAWATTISMSVAALLAVLPFLQKDAVIGFRGHGAWKLRGNTVGQIMYVGLNPFLTTVSAWIVGIVFVRQIPKLGGIEVLGVNSSIVSGLVFFTLFINSLCQGMQPIAGYNYGAEQPLRTKSVFSLTMKINVVIGIVVALLALVLPQILLRLFFKDENLIQIGVPIIRFLFVALPFAAFTSTSTNFFMSIGKPWVSIVVNLCQKLLFFMPFIYLVSMLLVKTGGDGLTGLWISRTISDVLGAVLAFVMILTQRHVFKSNNQVSCVGG